MNKKIMGLVLDHIIQIGDDTIPKFWNVFTDKAYDALKDVMLDKKEAYGFYEKLDEGYRYTIGVEVSDYISDEDFIKVYIPNKPMKIEEVLFKEKDKYLEGLSEDLYFYEFYPETFDFSDSNTKIEIYTLK